MEPFYFVSRSSATIGIVKLSSLLFLDLISSTHSAHQDYMEKQTQYSSCNSTCNFITTVLIKICREIHAVEIMQLNLATSRPHSFNWRNHLLEIAIENKPLKLNPTNPNLKLKLTRWRYKDRHLRELPLAGAAACRT